MFLVYLKITAKFIKIKLKIKKMKAQIFLFTSITCPSCHSAKSLIEDLNKERDDFELIEISMNTKEGQEEAKKMNIHLVPTFLIKGISEDFVGLIGMQSKKTINEKLNEVLEKNN